MIVWTDDEWDLLAEKVWDAMPENLDRSLVYITQQVVKQLPENRRRKIANFNEIEKLTQRLRVKQHLAKTAMTENRELRQSVADLREQSGSDIDPIDSMPAGELLKACGQRVLSLLSAEDVVAHFPAADLLAAIHTPKLLGLAVERLFDTLAERPSLLDSLRPAAGEAVREAPAPFRTPVSGRKPVVSVLGLLPQQLHELQGRVPGASVIILQPGSTPRASAFYVVWTRFVNHAATEHLRSRVSPSQYVLASGGIKTLARIINTRLESSKQ